MRTPMVNRSFDLALPKISASPNGKILRIEAPSDLYIPRVLEQSGLAKYEPETLACVLALVEAAEHGSFFDVGANVGVFSFLIAACSNWTVTAFEPTPRITQLLREIARTNELEIAVEELALGAATGNAEFFLSSTTDSSNSLREGFRAASGAITVHVQTLDAYCAEKSIWPSVLKIDTESTEPDVIRGATKLLTEHRPWIICEVLAQRTEQDLATLLAPFGYHWFQITNELPLVSRKEIFGDRSYTFNNWLFAPERPTDAFWMKMAEWRKELSKCVPGADKVREQLTSAILPLTSPDHKMSESWGIRGDATLCKFDVDGSDVIVLLDMQGSEKCYLCHGSAPLSDVAPEALRWFVQGGEIFEVEMPLRVVSGEPSVQLWAVQYNDSGRLSHENVRLRTNEDSRLRIQVEPSASSVRLALRFAGKGQVALGELKVFSVGTSSQ